jgi:SAM-dependent methyltransferase
VSIAKPAPPCPVCAGSATRECLSLDGVPVLCNRLFSNREAAREAPVGDIRLILCGECGFVFNRAFDPGRVEYSPDYDNSLEHSPCFRDYAESLANRLVRNHRLSHHLILEIGCGRGEFLLRLCRLGQSSGLGFDPGLPKGDRSVSGEGGEVRFVQGVFSARRLPRSPDLALCRHVLEHLPDPGALLDEIRRGCRPGTPAYIEVPNFDTGPAASGFWDIIYEHPSYFTKGSLAHLLRSREFRIENLGEAFKGQYLGVDARVEPSAGKGTENNPPGFQEKGLQLWAASLFREIETWKNRLSEWRRRGLRVVLWGAGSKGVTFLNLTGAADLVDYAVDLNPFKQRRFIPGTGTPVKAPRRIETSPPDVIIVVNPIYRDEIRAQAEGLLGRAPETVSL